MTAVVDWVLLTALVWAFSTLLCLGLFLLGVAFMAMVFYSGIRMLFGENGWWSKP